MIRLAFVALGCICVTAVSATTSYSFNLSRAYAGDDFFADWDYLLVDEMTERRNRCRQRAFDTSHFTLWQQQ